MRAVFLELGEGFFKPIVSFSSPHIRYRGTLTDDDPDTIPDRLAQSLALFSRLLARIESRHSLLPELLLSLGDPARVSQKPFCGDHSDSHFSHLQDPIAKAVPGIQDDVADGGVLDLLNVEVSQIDLMGQSSRLEPRLDPVLWVDASAESGHVKDILHVERIEE
jgi:hypothetical protein